jgi:hypothetical protein
MIPPFHMRKIPIVQEQLGLVAQAMPFDPEQHHRRSTRLPGCLPALERIR